MHMNYAILYLEGWERKVSKMCLYLSLYFIAQDQGSGFIIFHLHYHTMCFMVVLRCVDEMHFEKRGISNERKEERGTSDSV